MGWNNLFTQRDPEIKPDNANVDDVELKPAEVKAKFDSIEAAVKTSSEALDSKMAPMVEYFEQLKAEKDENSRKAAADRQKQALAIEPTEWLDDPEGATRKMIQPTNNALMSIAARATKQDVLGEKEYYYGDFKSKVDALIAQQPMANQCDPAAVANCYKVVLADHIEEINTGKLKSKTQAASFNAGGTGGPKGDSTDKNEDELSADEKFLAGKFRMTDAQWKTAKKSVEYV